MKQSLNGFIQKFHMDIFKKTKWENCLFDFISFIYLILFKKIVLVFCMENIVKLCIIVII